MRLLACLIVAPQRGYDQPATLSYAISSFCPTSADGLHAGLGMPTVNLTRILSEAGGISSVGGRIGGRISSVGRSGSSTIDPANVPTVGSIILCISM